MHLCLGSPIQAPQRAGFPNPVHRAHMGAAQRPRGDALRPSSGPVTQSRMHSEGMGRAGIPDPRGSSGPGFAPRHPKSVSGCLGMRPEGRAGPPLTCAHFGSSRSSPAAVARGLGSACEAPGHGRGRRRRRGDLRRGRAGRHLHDATETGTVLQSVCGRQAPPPPRRLRPPLPRELPGLVVPSLASVRSSQRS